MSAKTLSRVGKYQRARAEAGKCRYCSAPALAVGLCRKHREANRLGARNYYRLRHDIPVDAPVSSRGRPRVDDAAAKLRLQDFLRGLSKVSPTTSINGPRITRPV